MKGLEIAVVLLLVVSLPHLSMSGDTPGDDTPEEAKQGFSHLLQCTEKEIHMTACLNGGRCAAIKLFTSRLRFCRCGSAYKGSRCEEMDISMFTRASTIGLAVGVSLFVLILIMVVVVVVVCCRKRRRRRQAQLNASAGKNQMNPQAWEDTKANGGPIESPPGYADKAPALPKDDDTGVRLPLHGNGKINNDDEEEDDVFLGSEETQQAPLARPESYYDV